MIIEMYDLGFSSLLDSGALWTLPTYLITKERLTKGAYLFISSRIIQANHVRRHHRHGLLIVFYHCFCISIMLSSYRNIYIL